MIQSRVLIAVSVLPLLSGCQGNIIEGTTWEQSSSLSAHAGEQSDQADDGSGFALVDAAVAEQPEPEASGGDDEDDAKSEASAPVQSRPKAEPASATSTSTSTATAAAPAKPAASKAVAPAAPAEALVQPLSARVGTGDMQHPVTGPGPVEIAKLTGTPYTLVKNWDFGTHGTVRNQADLDSEFQYHDHFGTIANGTNYGSVTVASSRETAIGASGLGLPNDEQPVEDPARPNREWTAESLLAHVWPLSSTQQTASVAKHDTGNGSFAAKWGLPNGGELLGHDLVWETRVRMPKPLPGYWLALWTAGQLWDKGAEMDVLESFGVPDVDAKAFHSDSVGGTNQVVYDSWPNTLSSIGVPMKERDLPDWHTWTWVYLRDDSYEIYYDGYLVQHGNIHWTRSGVEGGQETDMHFLFDFSWGHTQVQDVNIELPASAFPLTYEIDYSRVYMR
jgi:hypothetical protein